MELEAEIVALLAKGDCRVIAFDAQGGASIPLPHVFKQDGVAILHGANPLDQVDQASHGSAVIAFEHARRHGSGGASVTLVGEDQPSWLEVFDLEASHGCFIAVATPMEADENDGRQAAELAPRQAHYELNVTGVIQSVSSDFIRMFGWPEDALIGKSSLDFIHPDDHEIGIIGWIELLENPGGQYRLRQRMKTVGGEWLWCELTETNLLDDPNEGYVGSEIVDVSLEMAAQAALQRRERLLDRLSKALPTGVLQLDAAGATEVRNDRWIELVGKADGATEDSGIDALLHHLTDPAPVKAAMSEALGNGVDSDLAVTFDGPGICRFGELHLRPLVEDAIVAGLLLTLDDVTKLHMHQLELAEQARRDPLTGAHNRLGVDEVMLDRFASEDGAHVDLTVLFLDLDRFKTINDTYGHIVGDEVLKSVSECISSLVRPTDLLGRLGGDEFLVVLEANTPTDQAEILSGRIQQAVQALAETFASGIEIGVSIGIAEAHEGDDFDSLIKRADAAMYAKKDSRKDSKGTEHSSADDPANV